MADADPSLTVAAVARRLGVAPATLRTWDRRYGLGPSEHSAGAHRRYTPGDVARLMTMRRLTLEGAAPSEAARSALDGASAGPSDLEVLDAYAAAAPMAPDPQGVASAARHLDNGAVRWMLARVHPADPIAWWSELLSPALRILESAPVLEHPGESAVRLLEAAAFAELRSRAAASVLRSGVAAASARGPEAGSEHVRVLALPVGASPDLVVHVIALALQQAGIVTRVLAGAADGRLVELVGQVAPDAVVVHVGSAETDVGRSVDEIDELALSLPGLPIFVHREGAAPVPLAPAPGVHRVRSLAGAFHELIAVLAAST
ncbi:MerR family transcriptional regulator [Actinotalea sp.]|uniref:MerR family transcriptional regulator n=1 Tax=Actinotalea sp. TaxID=1872145 RepID=UPI003569AA80